VTLQVPVIDPTRYGRGSDLAESRNALGTQESASFHGKHGITNIDKTLDMQDPLPQSKGDLDHTIILSDYPASAYTI
jgi:hypothetical protein